MKLIDYLKENLEYLVNKTKLKSKRLVLLCQSNKTLFSLLKKIGFWNFYSGNSGKIVGYSQVVAFLFCGGVEAYQNGIGSDNLEVHHINGDVTDDSPDNLVYLSREDHEYVSHVSYTYFHGRLKEQGSTPFNKRGRPITNPIHFLVNIIQETVAAVSQRRSGNRIELTFTEVLMALPQTIRNAPLVKQLPKWMRRYILLALNPAL